MRNESQINEAISILVTRLSSLRAREIIARDNKRKRELRAIVDECMILRSQLIGLAFARGDDIQLGVTGYVTFNKQ